MNFIMNKKTLPFNVKQTSTMIDKGTLTFNHPCQRPAGQWDIEKESLLIDSILRMFVPAIYGIQEELNGQKTYSIIDGKQRLTAIHRYLKDEFSLSNDLDEITLDSGGTFELAGKKFSELDTAVQETIKSFTLSFAIIEIDENDNEDQIVEEIFYRLNNGAAVSKQHLTFISTSPMVQNFVNDIIKNHNLFIQVAKFSDSQRKKSDPQISVLQTIMILSGLDYESLSAKHIEEFFQNKQISQELLDNVKQYFTILSDTFENQPNKFVQKIHIHSLCHLISKNMNQLDKVKDFILWYSENNKPADAYKNYCGAGNIKKEKTLSRLEGIEKEFKNWLKKQQSND